MKDGDLILAIEESGRRSRKCFASNVKQRREFLGWRQMDLAEMIGVTSAWVCHIERGARHPPLEKAVMIAEVLGVSLDDLCGIAAREASHAE